MAYVKKCSQCGLVTDYTTRDPVDGKLRCNCCQQDNMRIRIGLKAKHSLNLVFVEDGYDHDQYYSGHSHLGEKHLLSCIPAIVPAIQDESREDLCARLIHEINSQDWESCEEYYLVEPLSLKEIVTNKEIREAITEGLGDIDSTQEFSEDIYFYGYLHIYRGNEEVKNDG